MREGGIDEDRLRSFVDWQITEGSHGLVPVGTTEDIFSALQHQDALQTLYTGGTVFHGFLGERLEDWHSARLLVRRIAENFHLPYFTLSPTFTICPEHGYIAGEHFSCPHHHDGQAA